MLVMKVNMQVMNDMMTKVPLTLRWLYCLTIMGCNFVSYDLLN